MADTPIRKFLFDKSFDDGSVKRRDAERAAAPVPVSMMPVQIEALKKEAYDKGFAAGQGAGMDDQAQATKSVLSHLDGMISDLVQNLETLEKSRDAEMRRAVLAIAKKLLPDFTVKNGLQEIQALLNEAIAEMVQEPRLVVRIHETEFDAVNTKIHEITVQKAYAGKVVVLADAEIAVGDCRVEWADGGIERNVQTTWQKVEETVAPVNPVTDEKITEETNHG